ncbi:MAG: 4-hydroxyphenylpyruvate dioxygenase family protein [Myxococcota bacterium]
MTESLGWIGIESFQYFVHDIERSRRFYVDRMDFGEVGASTEEAERKNGERSLFFNAGQITVQVTCPLDIGPEKSESREYLSKHPDGIGRITYQVADARRAFDLLESRGGTPTTELVETGGFRYFDITTPFGPTLFRFMERSGTGLGPGFETYDTRRGGTNRFGFGHVDHVTSNFLTMSPALLWMEHVLGLERFWDVQFHTTDVSKDRDKGSGLRSVVMTDPKSGVKFANNEPWRPFFKQSQIYVFCNDLRGDGVQHVALTVNDIISAVKGLRERGVEFMHTPGTYYDALPARIRALGIGQIEEDVEVLRKLGILVDGEKKGSYLLQIFLKESASLYREPEAGPFFYEVIERKGDEGFGAGNFRALFESIEREQEQAGRT